MTIEVPAGMKLILFDCDGTLAHTLEIHWNAWLAILEEYGATEVELPFLERYNGMPTSYIVERVNEEFNLSLPVSEVAKRKDGSITEKLHMAQPIEPVVKLARREASLRSIAVLSGGDRVNVEQTLRAIDCAEIFQAVMCGDDDAPPKSDPMLYRSVAEQFSVRPEECFFIEDADMPMQAAQSVGMQVFDVRSIL